MEQPEPMAEESVGAVAGVADIQDPEVWWGLDNPCAAHDGPETALSTTCLGGNPTTLSATVHLKLELHRPPQPGHVLNHTNIDFDFNFVTEYVEAPPRSSTKHAPRGQSPPPRHTRARGRTHAPQCAADQSAAIVLHRALTKANHWPRDALFPIHTGRTHPPHHPTPPDAAAVATAEDSTLPAVAAELFDAVTLDAGDHDGMLAALGGLLERRPHSDGNVALTWPLSAYRCAEGAPILLMRMAAAATADPPKPGWAKLTRSVHYSP